MNKSIASTQGQKNKRYSVKKPSIAHFFVSQSRLTDAVSVIFGELLSYEHPPKAGAVFSGVGHNHVGIVIAWDGTNITIQEGNIDGKTNTFQEAKTDWQTKTYTFAQLNSIYKGVVCANPK